MPIFRFALAISLVVVAPGLPLAQQRAPLTPEQASERWKLENELQEIAIVERKLMLPMRDGVRLATDVYRPRRASDASGKVPIVWVRTPYNFNFWDVRNGVPGDMAAALTAVKRGYAYVVQNERGHFFSEGNYDILGAPVTDGYDALDWLRAQPWSNGKVGTTGCSSTAEYQMAVASTGHPAYAAMNVQGFGAGVGRVGPYYEQGNRYRGGASRCSSSPGSTASRTRCGRCFRPRRPARISSPPRDCSTWRPRCLRWTGARLCRTSRRWTFLRASRALGEFSPTRCRWPRAVA